MLSLITKLHQMSSHCHILSPLPILAASFRHIKLYFILQITLVNTGQWPLTLNFCPCYSDNSGIGQFCYPSSLTLVKGVVQSGPSSHSRTSTNLISVPVNFLCWAFHGNRVACYINVCLWFLLLRIVFSGLFLLVVSIGSFCLFLFLLIDVVFFLLLLTIRLLSCFQFSTLVVSPVWGCVCSKPSEEMLGIQPGWNSVFSLFCVLGIEPRVCARQMLCPDLLF